MQAYVGTAGHSTWFSEDLGQSWLHPNSHSGMYLEARVWVFSSHVGDLNHLYAGTDMGIFKWDESQARWSQLPSPMNDVWSLVQDPLDPNILIAGTRPAGFYRSTDAGLSWIELSAPGISQFSEVNQGPTRVTQILFDPLDTNVLWATVEIGGVYKSVDRGETWKLYDSGLVTADMHGIAVVQSPQGTSWVYATSNKGLHRSEDNGVTWKIQELPSPWQYTRGIIASPIDPTKLYLTNGNGPPGNDGKLFKSENSGLDWTEISLPGELNSTPWCLSVQKEDEGMRIWLATNLGQIFTSIDGGDTFRRLSHEFGEVRAIHHRFFKAPPRKNDHAITRAVIKARDFRIV